jgi:hypothetical protein
VYQVHLEGMAWAANELQIRTELRSVMQQRALEPVCTSRELILAAEALLLVLSGLSSSSSSLSFHSRLLAVSPQTTR